MLGTNITTEFIAHIAVYDKFVHPPDIVSLNTTNPYYCTTIPLLFISLNACSRKCATFAQHHDTSFSCYVTLHQVLEVTVSKS